MENLKRVAAVQKDRRLTIRFGLSIAVGLFLIALSKVGFAAPAHLRTNSLASPIGVGTSNPVFSWRSDSKAANWTQSAFQIVVTADEGLQRRDKPSFWDSGRVVSSESLDIRYAGKPLRSQQRYMWAIRVWDGSGKPNPWSRSSFETGLLSKEDWKAKWILRTDPAADAEIAEVRWIWLPGTTPDQVPSSTEAQFLYRLHLDHKAESASLHILAANDVTAKVNGHMTGHHRDWGAFDREETTEYLHGCENEIELDCKSRKGVNEQSPVRSAVAATIRMTDDEGKELRLESDGSWLARPTQSEKWLPAQVLGPMSLKYTCDINGQQTESGPDRIGTDVSLFRKKFSVAAKITSARLSVTSLGAYKAYVDGHAVAPEVLLAPGWTDFDRISKPIDTHSH